MVTKLKSNDFGSFEKHLTFTVPEPHSETLSNAGWEVVGEGAGGTEFKLSFTGRGTGKDEEALWELAYALPKTVPDNCWRVCWVRSAY